MAYLANKNGKDEGFQNRFAAMLAKHEGRKVPADTSKMEHDSGHSYDADTWDAFGIGALDESSRDEAIADIANKNYNFIGLEEKFEVLANHNQNRVLVEPSQICPGGGIDDSVTSIFEAAPKQTSSQTNKSQRLPEEGATRQKQNFRGWKKETAYDENGNPIPRLLNTKGDEKLGRKQAKAGRKVNVEEARERQEFEQRFNEVLAKHDGKRKEKGDNKADLLMGNEKNIVENRNEYRGKRKRQDEDGLLESMQHIPVKTGQMR
jgi:hypothetical protein